MHTRSGPSIHYVALGDSLTKGIGCSADGQPFPDHLFRAIRKSEQCRYINLGCSGMNSAELLHFLDRSGVRQECSRATDISITIGGNDFIRTYRNGGTLLHYVWTIFTFGRNLDRIIHKLKQMNGRSVIMVMGLYNPGQPSDPLFRRCEFLLQPLNRTYERVSMKHGALFINPYWHFRNKPELMSDLVHPNHQGYEVISRLFIENLMKNNVR